jgi:hypothetical protein
MCNYIPGMAVTRVLLAASVCSTVYPASYRTSYEGKSRKDKPITFFRNPELEVCSGCLLLSPTCLEGFANHNESG